MSSGLQPPIDLATARMVPAGYMAKYVERRPDWLQVDRVVDIYSVSDCCSKNFIHQDPEWRDNKFRFFDSPAVIEAVAQDFGIPLQGSTLFYHEIFEFEYDEEDHLWLPYISTPSVLEDVVPPGVKVLEGYDVVNFCHDYPECSPLSCNGLASEVETNAHCLLDSLERAVRSLESGQFDNSEPGPMRIIAVYTTDWP